MSGQLDLYLVIPQAACTALRDHFGTVSEMTDDEANRRERYDARAQLARSIVEGSEQLRGAVLNFTGNHSVHITAGQQLRSAIVNLLRNQKVGHRALFEPTLSLLDEWLETPIVDRVGGLGC